MPRGTQNPPKAHSFSSCWLGAHCQGARVGQTLRARSSSGQGQLLRSQSLDVSADLHANLVSGMDLVHSELGRVGAWMEGT